MKRFRLVLLVVAIAVLVPTVLLVGRSLQTLEIERARRHELVAERLFDEMERSLSDLLAREESRPVADYERLTSPRARPPEPFVLGYFEIEPNGAVRATGAELEAGRLVERAANELRDALRSPAVGADEKNRRYAQAPGSTVELEETGQRKRDMVAKEESKSFAAYDAIRSLNKAAGDRTERQELARSPGLEQAAGRVAAEALMAEAPLDDRAEFREDVDLADEEFDPGALHRSPMIGHRGAAGVLTLHRTVLHGAALVRQGLAIDADTLGAWLRDRTLDPATLGEGTGVSFAVSGAPALPAVDGFFYQHRFVIPFEALSARLVLAPLPDPGGVGSVYALAGSLLIAVLVGLAALDRMMAVVVRYAEQRSNFVAAVTHELKTPLTAIRMYGEMLRDGIVPSPEKRDEYYRHITAESERVTRLVQNVLELSRLENHADRPALVPGAIEPVVREAAELVKPHVEGAGFALRVDVEPDLPEVALDRDALLQILFNLVDNSVKYGAGEKSEIVLGARRSSGTVRVNVRDYGNGVSTRQQKRIFEPFHRAGDEMTRTAPGTGLGLALVHGLAERMGGRVTGRNASGGGFEVELELPVRERA